MKSNHILKQWQVMISAVFFLLAYPSSGQGNLIINGNFDLGSFPTNVPGWILTGSYSYWASDVDSGSYVTLSSFTGTPTASQTIFGLDAGVTYLISGDYRQYKGTSPDYSFGVAIDGTFLFQTANPGDPNWHSFNFYYTATSANALLSLSAMLNGTGIDYAIDNISMYAVPEPSALTLLMLGGGILFYVYSRNKKHSKPMSSA